MRQPRPAWLVPQLGGIDPSRQFVAVVGPGSVDPDVYALAFEVGRLLAEHGAVVVNGGLGGVMQASAEGVRRAGGACIGLLPDEQHGPGNPFLTVGVQTQRGEYRNAMIIESVDAVISVDCNWGTLSEVALAVATGKPVAALRPWRIVDRHGAQVGPPTFATAAEACGHVWDAADKS